MMKETKENKSNNILAKMTMTNSLRFFSGNAVFVHAMVVNFNGVLAKPGGERRRRTLHIFITDGKAHHSFMRRSVQLKRREFEIRAKS